MCVAQIPLVSAARAVPPNLDLSGGASLTTEEAAGLGRLGPADTRVAPPAGDVINSSFFLYFVRGTVRVVVKGTNPRGEIFMFMP